MIPEYYIFGPLLALSLIVPLLMAHAGVISSQAGELGALLLSGLTILAWVTREISQGGLHLRTFGFVSRRNSPTHFWLCVFVQSAIGLFFLALALIQYIDPSDHSARAIFEWIRLDRRHR